MKTDEQYPDAAWADSVLADGEDGRYADEVTDFDKELWSFVNQAVFETTAQKLVAAAISAQWDRLIKKTSTLGGYLQNFREQNGLSVQLCADRASVPIALWQDWEDDKSLPSDPEMQSLFEVTRMSVRKQREFAFLRATDPIDKLTMFCGLVRTKVAAEISPVTARHPIWGWLPANLQSALFEWGEAQCQKMPEYLSTFVQTLTNEKEQRAWAREILAAHA